MLDNDTMQELLKRWNNDPNSFKCDVLKTVEPHFSNVWHGYKTFEYRFNDRNFQEDQILILDRFPHNNKKSNKQRIITYVTHLLTHEDFNTISEKWVIMSIIVLDGVNLKSSN